jgi:ADP-L-glycero-D-manno-heptose 6-epimerase
MINDSRIIYIQSLLEDSNTYKILERYNFNVFFHCAAIVDTLFSDEKKIMEINALSIHNIINLCKQKNAKLIYSSSASIYGNTNSINKLRDISNPQTLYAKSKLEMENIAQNQKDIIAIGLRYFNVFGEGEQHKNNMASMIYKLHNGYNKLFKFGEQKRDFVYVKDVVQANIKASESNVSGIYNVGSGEAKSFDDIVCEINKYKDIHIEYIDNPYDFFQQYTCADLTETKKYLNYEPKYNLQSGIKEIYDM